VGSYHYEDLNTLQQGELMKKSYLTIALTLTSLLGQGIPARAQEAGGVSVTVPFEFVVDGSKTLPAGTYRIERVSRDSHSGLIIRSDENSAFLLPLAVDAVSAEQAELNFEHVGDKYFLSKVATPVGVYTIETPRVITKLAKSKDHGTASSSGN
jgi:hypothetical protein